MKYRRILYNVYNRDEIRERRGAGAARRLSLSLSLSGYFVLISNLCSRAGCIVGLGFRRAAEINAAGEIHYALFRARYTRGGVVTIIRETRDNKKRRLVAPFDFDAF